MATKESHLRAVIYLILFLHDERTPLARRGRVLAGAARGGDERPRRVRGAGGPRRRDAPAEQLRPAARPRELSAHGLRRSASTAIIMAATEADGPQGASNSAFPLGAPHCHVPRPCRSASSVYTCSHNVRTTTDTWLNRTPHLEGLKLPSRPSVTIPRGAIVTPRQTQPA